MDTPIARWKDDIPIAETTTADFEGRDSTCNLYDRHGVYRTVLADLAATIDSTQSVVGDYCLRVYLGHCADEMTTPTIRERFEQTRLVPPRGWLDAHRDELPSLDDVTIVHEHYETPTDRQISFQTAPTVYEMTAALIEDSDREDDDEGPSSTTPSASQMGSHDDVFKNAITFVADGYVDAIEDRGRLDDRPTTD